MALDQVSAVTQKAFVPVLVDNFFNSNVLLVYLTRKSTKLDGGTSIVQPVLLSGNSTAGSYSGADTFDIAFDEETTAAEFNWCQYYVTIGLTGLNDLQNSGTRAIINLIKTKMQVAEASLRKQMGADLQLDGTGNGGKAILGLGAAVDDGTNVVTYGNLSRTTYPGWAANLSTNAGVGRALTMSLLNTQFENCCKDNSRPNLLMTTHGVYTKYLSLLQPTMRTSDGKLANMGFQNLLYQGRPLVVDEQVSTTSGHTYHGHKIWILNTDYFELYVHKDRNFKWIPFQTMPNQDTAIAKILWAGQLVCSQPRLQCQVQDIDPTL